MNNLENLETIESYLNGQLSADERARFEAALRTNPAVADALTFYVLTKETARRQAHQQREQRRADFAALRRRPTPKAFADLPTDARPQWSAPVRWVAAASVVLVLGLGWFAVRGTLNSADGMAATRMADEYVAANLDTLRTTMGGEPTAPAMGFADSSRGTTPKPAGRSVQDGVGLYNQRKLAEAEAVFEDIVTREPDNDRALKYAGIVALRREKYDQAIDRFHRLSERADLLDTSGPFLEALARIKRNQPMDKEQAKKLLSEVISKNLEGKSEAEQLIQNL